MLTDTEIWEQAWSRVSGWKHGQVCKGCFFTPHESKEAVRNARWENGTAHHVDHDTPMPAIGDPAAVVAMVAWLAPSYAIIKKIDPNWQVNSGDWSPTLPLALAAAVLAVKE